MARGGGRGAKNPLIKRVLENHRDAIAAQSTVIKTDKNMTRLYPEFLELPLQSIDLEKIDQSEKDTLMHYTNLVEYWRSSPFYPRIPRVNNNVERYADKYYVDEKDMDPRKEIEYDPSMFPEELFYTGSKGKSLVSLAVKEKNVMDTISRLETEANAKGEKGGEGDAEMDQQQEEEEYEEENIEEGNDYIESYFDNGEGDDSDGGGDDGPVY